MARVSRVHTEDPEPRLKQPLQFAQDKLHERVRIGKELVRSSYAPLPSVSAEALQELRNNRYSWGDYNKELLRSLFSNPDRILREYRGGPMIGSIGGGPSSLSVQLAEFRDDMQQDVRRLTSIIERLSLFDSSSATPPASLSTSSIALRVFIVHGHNEEIRLAVLRFLEVTSTNFAVQVLSEVVNRGRTIIEKFEEEAGPATFAVVLLTGDDEGAPKGANERYVRGRQNVVLELGYFLGKLGRRKVVILHEEGVELPSDVHGIAYIPWDQHDGWKLKLEKELRAADHHLDLTKSP